MPTFTLNLSDETYEYITRIGRETGEKRSKIINDIILKSMHTQTTNISHLNNILAFLENKTEREQEANTKKQEIYREYIVQCKKDHFPVCTETEFFNILKNNIHLEETRIKNVRYYKGIKLLNNIT